MSETPKNFCARCMWVFLETLAVLLFLVVLGGGGLLWRLNSGPLDVSFAKDKIQSSLNDPTSGYNVQMDQVVLSWPDWRAPLTLEISGMQLLQDKQTVVQVARLDLGLAAVPLFWGQLEPAQIRLHEPALHLVRDAQGQISFGLKNGGPQTDSGEVGHETENNAGPLMAIVRRLAQPLHEIDDRSPLDHLQTLAVDDARMVLEDHVLGMTWFLPNLDLLFARQPEGLIATAALELPGGRDGAASLRADMGYDRGRDDFHIKAHIQDFDPHILSKKIEALSALNAHDVVINGDIEARLTADLTLQTVRLSLRSDAGHLALDGVYEAPLPYEALVAALSYDAVKGALDVEEISLTAKGITVALDSKVTISDADGGRQISAPINLKIPNLPQNKIATIWPDVLRGEPIEEWLLHKLSKGRVHDVLARLDFSAQEDAEGGWKIAADNIAVDFDIADMDVAYRAPLAPITQADGHGHFSGDVLKIDVERGKLLGLDVKKAQIAIDHIIAAGVGTADIAVALAGPLPDVFAYIGPEPIGMDAAQLGFDPAAVKGDAALDVHLSFPTARDLKAEQVKVTVKGTLNDVLLPDVVKTMDLTGGPLALTVGDGQAALSGKALLDGHPIDLSWTQYLETAGKPWESRIIASMKADQNVRDKLGLYLSDWLAGPLPVDVVYTEYGGGRAEIDVKADVTPAILMIAPFDFEKPVGVAGTAQAHLLMQNGHVQKLEGLTIDSVPLKLSGGDFYFRTVGGEDELARGGIKKALFAENDLGVEFEISPAGLVKLAIDGAFMDARPFLKEEAEKAPYDGPAVQASINVDRLRTHPARLINRGKIYFDMNDKGELNQLELDAIAGKGAIYFRFKPDESGKMTVRLEADDAGATLRAFDLYEDVQGGTLVLYGEAPNRLLRKHLVGHMQINNFHVTNAPILARLLGGMGPSGIPQMLGNDGIYFSRLESDFDWYIRPQGDLYLINGGRTSGSSLGLTFDGKIDEAQKQTDITGTIVPMSMINQFVSNIPLIGDILAGGKNGAIFAATYTIKGPSDNPTIAVNPLSVLTPGILRKILFEEDVEK